MRWDEMRGEANKRGRGTYACHEWRKIPGWIQWVPNSPLSGQDLILITRLVLVINILTHELSLDIRLCSIKVAFVSTVARTPGSIPSDLVCIIKHIWWDMLRTRAGCSPGPNVIPLALRVNFALGIDFYAKFHVESRNRCSQVWKCHLQAKKQDFFENFLKNCIFRHEDEIFRLGNIDFSILREILHKNRPLTQN